ncbi:hypothetical protein C8R48DRAFT_673968 [Suillus tomentosus]|nr:hypothetical protein C8R48DRAFT_673968 [Suillus tomentosus]
MPSSEISNKAFNEVTTGVLQIWARALQSSEGSTGHLNMATEMANIMTPAFQTHAQSATEIPPILLLAAMELMKHVYCVGQTSFLSVPVWNNIKSNDSCIEHHQLYGKAHMVITALAPAAMSQPPDTPLVEATTNTPAVPSVVAKSKPPGRSVMRKKLIDLCQDSDKVKIIGDITQSDALHKRKQRSTGGSEEGAVCHEDKVIAPVIVDKAEDVSPGNTNATPTRPRPKPKSKRVEIGRTDSEGLGFSSCAAPLTRVCALNFRLVSEESPKTSEGAGKFGMTFWTDTCNGYSGLVLSRSKQRKGCKDKVRSRIGPEDRGKDPDRLPETSDEWRIGGSELRPREFLPRPEMDVD